MELQPGYFVLSTLSSPLAILTQLSHVTALSFLSLFFLEFLVFSSSEDFLVFFGVPFFSRHFRGSVGKESPCFSGGGGFLAIFKKKQGNEGQGGDKKSIRETLKLQKRSQFSWGEWKGCVFLLTVEVFLLTVRLFYLRFQKRPNLISTVSKKDQTVRKKTKLIDRKQQRPTVSKKDLSVSKKDLPSEKPCIILLFAPPQPDNFQSFALIWPLSKALVCDPSIPLLPDANRGRVGFLLVLQAFGLFWGLGTQVHHLSFSTPERALSKLQKHYVLNWKRPTPTREIPWRR